MCHGGKKRGRKFCKKNILHKAVLRRKIHKQWQNIESRVVVGKNKKRVLNSAWLTLNRNVKTKK
jgi:hypothetical protein